MAVRRRILFFLMVMALMAPPVFLSAELSIPEKPSGYVTDLAGLLKPDEKARLEASLNAYEQKTTHQVVLLTLPSLEGEVLEETAIRTAEKWKPGQRGRDNGVLILIAVKEQAIRIEVGYGLEPYLTDLTAGRIIRNIMVPRFRAQDAAGAIQAGVSAVTQTLEGADLPELTREAETLSEGDRLLLQAVGWMFVLMLFFFLIDLGRYGFFLASHRKDPARYSFLEWFFIFSLLLAVFSTLLRILLHIALSSRGGYYGRGSGGGFSGGGGSFGGGGASGRW